MRTNVTGFGRKGMIEDGVGRLEYRADSEEESRILKVLFDEFRKSEIGFWAAIILGATEKEADGILHKIAVRGSKKFNVPRSPKG